MHFQQLQGIHLSHFEGFNELVLEAHLQHGFVAIFNKYF